MSVLVSSLLVLKLRTCSKELASVNLFYSLFIASQLVAYFDAYDLLPAHQSGFRRNHSTETL